MSNTPENDDLFLAELYAEILSWPLPQENKTADLDNSLGRESKSAEEVTGPQRSINDIVHHSSQQSEVAYWWLGAM